MTEQNQGKLVRLAFDQGRPAIVTRNAQGELTTQIVSSHEPYKRALAQEVAQRHRGAFQRLADYDRRGGR